MLTQLAGISLKLIHLTGFVRESETPRLSLQAPLNLGLSGLTLPDLPSLMPWATSQVLHSNRLNMICKILFMKRSFRLDAEDRTAAIRVAAFPKNDRCQAWIRPTLLINAC